MATAAVQARRGVRRRQRAVFFAVLVALPVVGWLALSWLIAGAVIGNSAWREIVDKPERLHLEYEDVKFRSRDGLALTGWWLPANDPRATVIMAHGGEGNRSALLPKAAFLVGAHYNVLLVDLRAHGGSEGDAMSSGYLEARDVLGGLDFARSRAGSLPTVLFGYSLGAVAVLHAAGQDERLAAVIADSPHLSMADLIKRGFAYAQVHSEVPLRVRLPAWLATIGIVRLGGRMMYRLRTGASVEPNGETALDAAQRIRTSAVLYLSGNDDTISPPATLRQLYAETPSPRKNIIVINTHFIDYHDAFAVNRLDYQVAVEAFLNQVIPLERAR